MNSVPSTCPSLVVTLVHAHGFSSLFGFVSKQGTYYEPLASPVDVSRSFGLIFYKVVSKLSIMERGRKGEKERRKEGKDSTVQ
jgi:hypothetical protein